MVFQFWYRCLSLALLTLGSVQNHILSPPLPDAGVWDLVPCTPAVTCKADSIHDTWACNRRCFEPSLQVTVAAYPEPFIVKRNVSSICTSAMVGQYFGFYNKEGVPACFHLHARMLHLRLLMRRQVAWGSAATTREGLQPLHLNFKPRQSLTECMACAGGSIDQLTVTCKGAYSRVLGLLRLGGKTGRASRALNRMDFVEMAAI